MKVAVVSRTEANGRRILEGCFVDDDKQTGKDKACDAKVKMLKHYEGRLDLCADTEIDVMEAQ